jgi:hypothetical protein
MMTAAVTSSTDLELVALDRCPGCGEGEPVALVIEEPALFGHGGYGETRSTTILLCPCGWELTRAVDSTRPLEARADGRR